ncbi:hypothetical protein M569_07417 [Genlisea aurea]|uniref:Uncharacterized protein n=1 Tax=Genlisea aurea TaxID=192259 RepID=S8DW31_9LAMI|nr:hypothetical protein M569_07417 [Genlisea aurea]
MNATQGEEDSNSAEEILKAAAQAWRGHSGNSKSGSATSEFEAHRKRFSQKPTRFRLEAMTRTKKDEERWDFEKSLWDSYEIVAVTKRLERELVFEGRFYDAIEEGKKRRRRRRRSLRDLFTISSSSSPSSSVKA